MRLKLDKKTGPLYWCTYEKQFTENTFMPEERFKENIDWVAKEFVPYGYEMVCTDGWIEDSFCINENGYLTRHHDSWKHDWKYWARAIGPMEPMPSFSILLTATFYSTLLPDQSA